MLRVRNRGWASIEYAAALRTVSPTNRSAAAMQKAHCCDAKNTKEFPHSSCIFFGVSNL
jgi:ABC-type polysaccharide transport system permease subunit